MGNIVFNSHIDMWYCDTFVLWYADAFQHRKKLSLKFETLTFFFVMAKIENCEHTFQVFFLRQECLVKEFN